MNLEYILTRTIPASIGHARRASSALVPRKLLAGAAISLLGSGMYAAADGSVQAVASQAGGADGSLAFGAPSGSGAEVLDRANAFMAMLDDEQRAALLQEYTFANAARWHTFPQWGMRQRQARIGLALGTLSDAQWSALNALLAAATGSGSNEGFDEIQQHLAMDDWIRRNGGREGYGRGNFYIAFLGAPSDSGIWQLQFGGHHLALTNTYRDGVLVGATPSFRAIEPHTVVELDGVTIRPQRDEWEAFVSLLASLDRGQTDAAELGRRQRVLLLGPEVRNKDWNFPARVEGIAAASLTETQRALLLKAISLYVNDIADADAELILARYERELDTTYLSFSGSPSLTRTGDYVRIDGPSVWIELAMDPAYSTDQPHVHAVWRDKRTDYGGTRPGM
ncbi:DUF3500 domain-containing protein [Halotalea alkalilenta]|uniref:DUF3500 domain-containing protein n=1 Tax=Halotalea alkalilenta TaxID=376489 RepID=A0A172YD46_9GAMM|nr:DUF3500 domain-containing protein [Halotalea alkalilenta]ANF57158.1 hypothetical protein A5892_06510 [Halotalea alkalilenta]